MKRKTSKFIFWTPRILAIAFIVFLMMFSLDVFTPGLNFWQIVGALFMHNLFALILLIFLIISWKYEIVGGIVFTLAGLSYIVRITLNREFEWYMLSWILTIAAPAIFIGILFIINWVKKW